MDNKKNDRYYVERILKDLSFVIKHTEEILFDDFENNEILLDSVMFRFIQISENTKLLSNQFKNEHDNVPWIAIIGTRNKIVHEYGKVDLSIIYHTVKNDLKGLKSILESLI